MGIVNLQVEERQVFSSPLQGSSAAINGFSTITADVMCGMDTMGWPKQETAWWSPPMPWSPAAINAYTAYDYTKDVPRARQAYFWQKYQEQNQPFWKLSFPAAVGTNPYDNTKDVLRARQAFFVQPYHEQRQALVGVMAAWSGTGSTPPPPPPPTYLPSRYIVHLPVRPFTISIVNMQTFNVKDPSESVPLTFDMSPDLQSGETLVASPTVTVSVVVGTDPSPGAIINGVAGFDSTLTQVIQPVTGGLTGVTYQISVLCATSNPVKTLRLIGNLPVRSLS